VVNEPDDSKSRNPSIAEVPVLSVEGSAELAEA